MHYKLFIRPGSPWRDILGRQIVTYKRTDGTHVYLGDRGAVLRSSVSLDGSMGRSESVEGEEGGDRVSVPAIGLLSSPPEWARDAVAAAPPPVAITSPSVQELLAPALLAGDEVGLLTLLNTIAAQSAPWYTGAITLTGPVAATPLAEPERSEPDAGPPT